MLMLARKKGQTVVIKPCIDVKQELAILFKLLIDDGEVTEQGKQYIKDFMVSNEKKLDLGAVDVIWKRGTGKKDSAIRLGIDASDSYSISRKD